MSTDIRSFFISKKVPKPKQYDDDDVIPESPDVQIKNKKKETRKRCVILDDSDEEIFPTKKKISSSEKKKVSSSEKKKVLSQKNKQSPKKNTLKEIKLDDFFGGPVKRTEPLVTKAKKKNTEIDIHSDDEFNKSLLELDIPSYLENSERQNNDSKINQDKTVKTEKTGNVESSISESQSKLNAYRHIDGGKEFEIIQTKIKDYEYNHKKFKEETLQDNTERKADLNALKKKTQTFAKDSLKEYKKKNGVSHSIHDHEKLQNVNRKMDFSEFIDDVEAVVKSACNEHENKNKNGSSSHKKIKTEVSQDETNRKRDINKCSGYNDTHDHEPKNKKSKRNTSLNESVLTDQERHERRMQSAALYKNYLNRPGPKHLGSKEVPEGRPDCLKDCAFLLTGVLDSFERDDITNVITKYGGCIKKSISKKVTHLLAGEDASPAKLAKSQDMGIKIINEDDLLNMIKNSLGKTCPSLEIKKEIKTNKTSTELRNRAKDNNIRNTNNKRKRSNDRVKIKEENFSKDTEQENNLNEKVEIEDQNSSPVKSEVSSSLMWVDKYKPQTLKQIIGQRGAASNVNKLSNWLTKWYVNRKAKLPKPSPWAKQDDGGYYKAALLSGPPGVGKTTTVALVCKELGFDAVEFNASDTRSKTLIKQQIGELLTTTSLSAYAKGYTGKQAITKKHVLVMDEVDGMAGNEDRGGLQELIALIKTTSVPIICMCNDRSSPKMRSLVNYCYDLRFNRPTVDQIKSAMMSICYKESVKIPPDTLAQMITAAGQDVRQTVHALSMWAADTARGQVPDRGRKDVKMGPWEAIRKVFSAEEHKNMSLNDKSDLFFCDYSLAPLFVQENYLSVVPHCDKSEVLDRISKAADSISIGDLIDSRIRSNQAWSLLPLQAMYSSVIPGYNLSGHVAGQIQFPGWLGKNSRKNKMHRLCQEIHAHTRLSTSGSKSSIYLDYATHLRDAVYNPLIKDKGDGISKSLEVLESYHLLREDLDSLMELSLWPGQRNLNILIDPKIKAAMTRTYNKQASPLPYSLPVVRKGRARDAEGDDDELEENEDDLDNDNPESDAFIKKKSNKSAEIAESHKIKAGSSKEKKGGSSKGRSQREEKKK